MRKKVRDAGEETDAAYVVPLRFREKSFYQLAAGAQTFSFRNHRDRANLRQVHAVKVQRAATDNLSIMLNHNEVTHVFAEFCHGAGQERAITRVRPDDGMDLLYIRQD